MKTKRAGMCIKKLQRHQSELSLCENDDNCETARHLKKTTMDFNLQRIRIETCKLIHIK